MSKFLVKRWKFRLNPDKIGLQGFTEPAQDKWVCMMPLCSTSSGAQTAENGYAGKTSQKTVMTGVTAKMERTLGESFPPKDAAPFESCDRHSGREWREHLSGAKLTFVTLPFDPPSQNVRKVYKTSGLWRSKQEHERGITRWCVNFSEQLISNSGGRSGCLRAALNTAFLEKKTLCLILKVPYYTYF